MKVEDLLSEKDLNYFYIMHLSYEGDKREELWNYARENKCIGLDYPSLVKDDWNKISNDKKEEWLEDGSLSHTWRNQFDRFCNKMKKGDIVLVLSGCDSLLGIAEIEDRYRYVENLYPSQISSTT